MGIGTFRHMHLILQEIAVMAGNDSLRMSVARMRFACIGHAMVHVHYG